MSNIAKNNQNISIPSFIQSFLGKISNLLNFEINPPKILQF